MARHCLLFAACRLRESFGRGVYGLALRVRTASVPKVPHAVALPQLRDDDFGSCWVGSSTFFRLHVAREERESFDAAGR